MTQTCSAQFVTQFWPNHWCSRNQLFYLPCPNVDCVNATHCSMNTFVTMLRLEHEQRSKAINHYSSENWCTEVCSISWLLYTRQYRDTFYFKVLLSLLKIIWANVCNKSKEFYQSMPLLIHYFIRSCWMCLPWTLVAWEFLCDATAVRTVVQVLIWETKIIANKTNDNLKWHTPLVLYFKNRCAFLRLLV